MNKKSRGVGLGIALGAALGAVLGVMAGHVAILAGPWSRDRPRHRRQHAASGNQLSAVRKLAPRT